MADPKLLEAVTAAVTGEAPPEEVAPVEETPPAGETPPEGAPPVEETPPAGEVPPEGAPPVAPVVDANGRLHDPVTGKLLPKAADPAAPAAAAPPAAAAAPVAPPKPPDHVNDPPPKGAKPETVERITFLAGKVKETTEQLETTRGDMELLLTPIREAGASVEQFQEAMDLVKLLNSPHQHEQMQALQRLQGTATELATRLGQVPPGADPLQGQDDLLEAVRANPNMRAWAEEVARARRLTVATQQHQQTAVQRTQQEQARQQAAQSGQAAVRSVEQTLEASDPQYAAKVAMLRADTAFLAKMRQAPPTQWAPMFAEKYRTIKVAAAPAAAAAAARPGATSPLRAKQPAGTAAKPPGSALDAVRGALGMS
jgi:hypothetical protein